MIKGYQTLTEFAEEIERIENRKQDYLVPSSKVFMSSDTNLVVADTGAYELNNHAHGQLASKLGIPKRYYDKMQDEVPGLRSYNVNAWIKHEENTYLVRTLDSKARAVLSNRYRIIDNLPILKESIFPVIASYKEDLQVKSFNLSDTKMYLQIIFPSIQYAVNENDIMKYGITITNSEVGAGAFDIKSFFWRLVCSNGLIAQSLIRKYHSGRETFSESDDAEIYKDDTIQSELNTYKLKVRDIIDHALNNREEIEKLGARITDAINQPIGDTMTETIKNVTKRYSGVILESDDEKIMRTIILEKNHNKWGMVNGITALAKEIDDIDRQYALEKAGWDLLSTSNSEWRKIAA